MVYIPDTQHMQCTQENIQLMIWHTFLFNSFNLLKQFTIPVSYLNKRFLVNIMDSIRLSLLEKKSFFFFSALENYVESNV